MSFLVTFRYANLLKTDPATDFLSNDKTRQIGRQAESRQLIAMDGQAMGRDACLVESPAKSLPDVSGGS